MNRQRVVTFAPSPSHIASVGTMNDRATQLHRLTRRPLESELELRHLRAFVALVEHGSITAASRALGFAQSTVSEALAALERALGTKVVQRHPGAQAGLLTAAGHALLPHAREVLAAVDHTHAAIAEMVTSARGMVEIVANESVSTYVLPEVLAHVRTRWPNTGFPVSVSSCAAIRQRISHGLFDIGLFMEEETRRVSRGQTASSLAKLADRYVVSPRVPLIVFAHPTHPLVTGRPVPRSALSDVPLFVGDDAAGHFHTLIQRFFRDDGVRGPRIQTTGSVEGVKRVVITDPGALGILPLFDMTEELRTSRVAVLDLQPAPPHVRVVALVTRSRPRHPSICELIDVIRRRFATDRKPGEADRGL